MKKEKEEKKSDMLKWFLIGSVIIITLWIGSAFFLDWWFESPTNRGAFGDMFGGINALFSGIALIGIVISIIYQQKELGLQYDELKNTRQEFSHARYTNVIFKKTERVNKLCDKIIFKHPTKNFTANDHVDASPHLPIAQISLKSLLDIFTDEYEEVSSGAKMMNDQIIKLNKIQLLDLLELLKNDLIALERLIDFSKIELQIKNELFFVYFTSIHPEIIRLTQILSPICDRQIPLQGDFGDSDEQLLNIWTYGKDYYQKLKKHEVV